MIKELSNSDNLVFESELDNISIAITYTYYLLIIVLCVLYITLNIIFFSKIFLAVHCFALFILINQIFVFLLYPRFYEISNESIIIHRWLGSLQIDRSEILSVAILSPSELKGAICLFGSSGVHGYFGWFRSTAMGKFLFYASKRRKCIKVLRANKCPLIISPNRVEDFLEALHTHS